MFSPSLEMSEENTPVHRPFRPANSFSTFTAPTFVGFRGTSRRGRQPARRRGVAQFFKARSEPAPVGRDAVVAMQLRFLRAIAPVEILVGAERRRAPQFLIVDVELIGFEPGIVGETRPWQRQQAGSHAEETAETEYRVRDLAGNLVDHQPLDMAESLAVRPPYGGAFDPVACNQLVGFCHDVGRHQVLPEVDEVNQRVSPARVPAPLRRPRNPGQSSFLFWERSLCLGGVRQLEVRLGSRGWWAIRSGS